MVRDDGEELYLVNDEAPWDAIHAHEWLEANVVPHLDNNQALWVTRHEMKPIIVDFLIGGLKNRKDRVELFAWYSAYDHVCLAQIFGRMIDLPSVIPMYTNDVRSLADWLGVKSWPKQVGGNHDALEDARHLRKVYDHIIQAGTLKIETS